MGVDYTGQYGVGVRVSSYLEEDSEYDDFMEFLESNLHEDYTYFEVGKSMYTGIENEFYIVISEPFLDGYDLTHKKKVLLNHLDILNIEVLSEFGCLGGLLIH